jgi:hypothetical protein
MQAGEGLVRNGKKMRGFREKRENCSRTLHASGGEPAHLAGRPAGRRRARKPGVPAGAGIWITPGGAKRKAPRTSSTRS